MSIINKMLQELEQRHAEDPAKGALPGQLRAVPLERSERGGWLAAAVLAALLIGLLLWMWLRPAPVAKSAGTVPAAQLALKIAPTIPQQLPAVPESAALAEAVKPTEATPAVESEQTSEKNTLDVSTDRANKADKPDVPKPVVADMTVVPKPEPVKAASRDDEKSKAVQATPSSKSSQPTTHTPPASSNAMLQADTPLVLDKQIRALTPQQKAENDYRRATGLIEQGRAAEAGALLEQVVQTDPTHAAARQTLIALLLKSKRQDEAMRYAKEGLDLNVKQAGFAMIQARLQVEKGEQQAAIDTLQRTLPYVLDRPDYRAFLAALLQREGRHKEAIEQYLLSVRLSPQNGVWWMGLGISMQADGRAEEAREAFSRARETNSLSPELQAFVEQKLKQLSR